jgi:PKHD-type hydroxylase
MPSFPKYMRELPHFVVAENYFTPEEVDRINDLEELQEFSLGKVGYDKSGKTQKEVRDSHISWLFMNNDSQWIFDKFNWLVAQTNHSHFMQNIDGFEAFQYTKYSKGQHYTWHFDYEPKFTKFERKISATIILSDPKKYSGGEFEIVTDGNIEKPQVFKPNPGTVILFASWMPHRVAPIKSGVRKSLVAWVMGERSC